MKKVFIKSIRFLAEDKKSVEKWINKRSSMYGCKSRGCCEAISEYYTSFYSFQYRDYFDAIFERDARKYWGKKSRVDYYFDGITDKRRSKKDYVKESYTSRVIALSLAQILWDEDQKFNKPKK